MRHFCHLLAVFYLFPTIFCDELTRAPEYTNLEREHGLSTSNRQTTRVRSQWAEDARRKLLTERDSMQKTPYAAFSYDGAPSVDIIFKDESVTKTGSSHYRTMWNVFIWAIDTGLISQGLHLYDGSLGGDSAIAFAYFSKLIGLRSTVFVPFNISRSKLRKIIKIRGAWIIRASPSLLVSRPQEEAERRGGVFFNYNGNAARALTENNAADLAPNLFTELKEQLQQEEGIDKIDHFVTTVDSGALLSSIYQSIEENSVDTKLFAVDSQFSVLYDYAVHGRFQDVSGRQFWKSPGLVEVGFGPQTILSYEQTTSFRPGSVDGFVKLPDLAVVAAMHLLREKGIDGGPATAANFLASLLVAANEPAPLGKFTTIATVLTDSGQMYEQTYFNETWTETQFAHHGGLQGIDCWRRAIESSLVTGWNPMNVGLEKGCPISWKQEEPQNE